MSCSFRYSFASALGKRVALLFAVGLMVVVPLVVEAWTASHSRRIARLSCPIGQREAAANPLKTTTTENTANRCLKSRYQQLPLVRTTRYSSASRVFLAAQSDDEDDDEDDEDDDDIVDEEEPLAKGVDSVAWLPSVVGAKRSESTPTTSIRKGVEILPLFPLGGIVYTPNSEHILNIFEPRYRQMYSDILMSGSKRFVVSMSHPTEAGRFAEMGVLFELKELKEVSEQTADQIKYICNHQVTGRVKLHRIINPEAWESRETYLRVEGTITDDSGKKDDATSDESSTPSNDVYGAIAEAAKRQQVEDGNPKEEKALRDAFVDLVEMQHELEEDVRFTRASVLSLAVKPGAGKDGLWQTIRLWQSFADQRLMSRQNEMQKDFQEKLQEFLKKDRGLKEDELPRAIGFQDLTPALQEEVKELQKRMALELRPLVMESTLTMQKVLEAPNHTARLKLVRLFVQAETKRLITKKALRGMFAASTSEPTTITSESTKSPDAPSPAATLPPLDEKPRSDLPSTTSSAESSVASVFFDEPDAFQ